MGLAVAKSSDETQKSPRRSRLERLATLFGLVVAYSDGEQEIHASDVAIERVLAEIAGDRLDFDPADASEGELAAAIERRETQLAQRWLEPVLVSWTDREPSIFVRPGDREHTRLALHLTLEDAGEHRFEVDLADCKAISRKAPEGGRCEVRLIDLPPDIPMGYHRLRAEWLGAKGEDAVGDVAESILLRAPRRSYEHEPDQPTRRWGLFAPVHAIRSDRDTGMGDLTELRTLAQLTFERGGSLVGTLPMLATCLAVDPPDPSPYAPVSRRYWNELLIDPERTDEWSSCAPARELAHAPAWQSRAAELRTQPLVDYLAQRDLRRPVLEALAGCFFSNGGEERPEFAAFLDAYPDARDYARFRAKTEQEAAGWQDWRNVDIAAGEFDPDAERYHLYGQYAFARQLEGIRDEFARAGGMMYLDLPVGAKGRGYDTWRHRELFCHALTVGAPPDAMFDHGQLWGFPPAHPETLRETGYAFLRASAREFLRLADYLRLDHVTGMHRLYLTPRGLDASQGVYVAYAHQEQYAVLNIESHRHRCQLVGENLGMVPPAVDQALADHGYGTMYIAEYFSQPKASAALPEPELRSVTSLNTHDTPTFRAWWEGRDIADLLEIGLLDEGDVAGKDKERVKLTESLARFLRKQGRLDTKSEVDAEHVMRALTSMLAAGPAEIILVTAEDLWGETHWQNIPGTFDQHPNWRHRWATTLEALARDTAVVGFLDKLTEIRKKPAIDWPKSPEPQPEPKGDTAPKPKPKSKGKPGGGKRPSRRPSS